MSSFNVRILTKSEKERLDLLDDLVHYVNNKANTQKITRKGKKHNFF